MQSRDRMAMVGETGRFFRLWVQKPLQIGVISPPAQIWRYRARPGDLSLENSIQKTQ